LVRTPFRDVGGMKCSRQSLSKNSEIVKKSEFFYALVARFCSLLYCFVWLGWYTCFNEKTTLVLESGFGIFVFCPLRGLYKLSNS
jgi:hypothetical protein